jgi:phospholipid/cholesterol/gamma-HCH transport system substrate-binding protein
METNVNYTLIGLFVVIFTAALIGGVLWLGADIQAREYKTYRVYMTESVSGLEENALVKYRGVDVGLVQEISLNPRRPDQVELLLDIESDVVVRENDTARLETSGVTGVYYINIAGGTPDAPPVDAPPGKYPVIESNPSFLGRLDMTLSAMSEKLIVTSNKINDMLSDDNRESVARILDNLEAATGSLASGRVDAALSDLAASLRNTRVATARLPDVFDRVESSLASIEATATQFAEAADGLKQVVTTSGGDVTRFTAQALPEATALVAELRLVVENLRRLSEEIARDPSTIIYGAPEPQLGPGE